MMAKIGLYDVDSHRFPNLPLMKISAYHKAQGDDVEWWFPLLHYDIVYVSKVFGDEYSQMDMTCFNAEKVVYGGTGFAITIENGKEVYHKDRDKTLPYEIEHIYPDYSLYPELTEDKAYGFLTRGCSNACEFCIVSEKEGRCSFKAADLSEWWNGQKEIILLDPNILACKDRKDLLQQLIDSGARVDFNQGLDARFITPEIAEMLKRVNTSMYHFAFDFMKNEKQIIKGLQTFMDIVKPNPRNAIVYILTNFDTTFEQDYYRVKMVESVGMTPDIRIYRKNTAPKLTRDLQRWCNNRFVYHSTPDFMEYRPRKCGRTIKQIYFKGEWARMTDRERLVERIQMAVPPRASEFAEVIADELLADGWMRPPCKVGQTVYQTQPTRNRVQEYEVTALKFNGSCYFFSWVLKDGKGFYENVEGFSEFQIGATVFLTREEAVNALRGGEEG